MDFIKESLKTLPTDSLYLVYQDATSRIGTHYTGGLPDKNYIRKQESIISAVQDELISQRRKWMYAGPELDTLIAEKVMGWKVIKFENIGLVELVTEDDRLLLNEFRPSRDIVDAWKVVERFKGSRFLVCKGLISELQQVVTPDEIKASGNLLHESELIYYLTPLAICIAGLRAIGIEVDHD